MSRGRFSEIREQAYFLNMEIPKRKLAIYTWGNVSIADRSSGIFAIKPSGINYEKLTSEDIVIVDFEGKIVDGKLNPSSDTPTHAVLYRSFPETGGIVHTHSTYATGWSQSLKPITVFGTTHADHTIDDIPCTPPMSDEQIKGNYETETGYQIVNYFRKNNIDPVKTEMVLVGSHGPFTWGKTGEKAVYNAVVLEELAKMALITLQVNQGTPRLKEALRNKHFLRKHGKNAYYGQGEKNE